MRQKYHLGYKDLPSSLDVQRLFDLVSMACKRMRDKGCEWAVVWADPKTGILQLHVDAKWTLKCKDNPSLHQHFTYYNLISNMFLLRNPQYRGCKVGHEVLEAFRIQIGPIFQSLLLALEHMKI